jgi:mono/diheme cytochrome c family protein
MTNRSTRYRAFAAGVFGALLVLVLIGLAVVWTGGYNVAATQDHTAPVKWALQTTMENSIKTRADSLTAPARMTPQQIMAGGGRYKAMCQQCHGGPGVERAEWARGLNPSPPDLTRTADDWRSREVFWILKHGIKMSAMPSFGGTHDDATLWSIAAFVKQLPKVSPARYAEIESEHGEEGGHSGHGAQDAGEGGHSH